MSRSREIIFSNRRIHTIASMRVSYRIASIVGHSTKQKIVWIVMDGDALQSSATTVPKWEMVLRIFFSVQRSTMLTTFSIPSLVKVVIISSDVFR